MTKKILVICDASPFDNQRIRDSLDMALIFAAVDQEVSWLFRGPSVLALKKDQQPTKLGIKDFLKQLKTLEIYDVDRIFACESALAQFALAPEQISIDIEVLDVSQQKALIDTQEYVVKL
ncbi:sulfurtransferase complex subunit TusC [Pseudoalteromonas obscura]|uniref:Sulfurtransferase complex subunit TusC n=1 Tax=Pseudoalteromonas obscura TaxID=3048491 RepID=A0ABT7EEP3_9GAMM|nr:sulfurtransferase complex subunit TusC [Pseudoalteromonas sp. P94(2023)]MDK2593741.1 sulfurtransferase complex subunit TusC [Pseudoalteromonas sp. P94(2023)]